MLKLQEENWADPVICNQLIKLSNRAAQANTRREAQVLQRIQQHAQQRGGGGGGGGGGASAAAGARGRPSKVGHRCPHASLLLPGAGAHSSTSCFSTAPLAISRLSRELPVRLAAPPAQGPETRGSLPGAARTGVAGRGAELEEEEEEEETSDTSADAAHTLAQLRDATRSALGGGGKR